MCELGAGGIGAFKGVNDFFLRLEVVLFVHHRMGLVKMHRGWKRDEGFRVFQIGLLYPEVSTCVSIKWRYGFPIYNVEPRACVAVDS